MSAIIGAIVAAVLGFFRGLLADIRQAAAQRDAGRAEQRADEAEATVHAARKKSDIDAEVDGLSDRDLDERLSKWDRDS